MERRTGGCSPWSRRFLMTAVAAVAIAVLGSGAYASRQVQSPGQAAGLEGPATPERAISAAAADLYAVPPSPFMHGSIEGTFSPVPADEARRLEFSNGIGFDTRHGEPSLPPTLRLESYGDGERGYYLVQFEGPVREAWRRELENSGAEVLSYIPNYAYLVGLDEASYQRVRDLAPVVWIGLYQPAYKVSGQPELALTTGRQIVTILLFPGESIEEISREIATSGGAVLETSAGGPNLLIRADIDRASVPTLAGLPAVAWIEPWHPQELHNHLCQWVLQTWVENLRRVWDHGITGEGQILSSADTGVRPDHLAFYDPSVPLNDFGDYPTHRRIIGYHKTLDAPDIVFGDHSAGAYHGTHTAGTLCGNDSTLGVAPFDGMAKDARLYHLDGGGSTYDGVLIPIDLYGMFVMPYEGNAAGAARIMSNSWGHGHTSYYDSDAMQVDQFMWDHPDFLLFFSAGNEGGPMTIGSPATAKNCVTVGGTRNGLDADRIYWSTSRGPTQDGRQKPTLCAPAFLTSAHGASADGYVQYTGTSMSSPAAASTMALARQYLMEGWYPTGSPEPANAFAPSAALVKAAAINTGHNDIQAYTAPDNNVGWGRLEIDRLLYFPGDTRHSLLVDNGEGLVTGEYVEYQFCVTSSSEPLRISLVWTDYPGTPGAATILVNDLDLLVTGGGFIYRGNVFSSGQSIPGGTADELNVEECVWHTTPATGAWKVRIEATNIPFGPQPFALVVSGALAGDAGVVMLDRSVYSGDDTVEIRVEDVDAASPITVLVSSDTETTPESVSLTGSGGVFTGSFPTTMVEALGGDGALSVAHGDGIQVDYNDANPPHTASATAEVAIYGPVITNVNLEDVGSTTAVVSWDTSVPATARVHYGLDPNLGSSTDLDTDLVTSHLHSVSGLLPDTTYYYDVESTDHQGNTVRDDNGGQHYRLTTRVRGDILLVIGDETFEEEEKYTDAFTRTGWAYDEWGEALALDPPVGDLDSGLRSYRAVWWQVGWEQYPPFSDAARESITRYSEGSGRISVVSHDVAWTFADSTSGYWTQEREDWLRDELKVIWQDDPQSFSFIKGYAGDPISGDYTANVSYTPHRGGAAGDEIDYYAGTGTANYVWKNAAFLGDDIALRWESGTTNGDPDSAIWGGTPTQLVTNCFEWSRIRPAVEDDSVRADILDKTLLWLIGRNHPEVEVTSPNGGEVLTGNSVLIYWNEATDPPGGVAGRRIDMSDDGGESWSLVSGSPGTSPYLWDISAVPNGAAYRVRVTVVDNGTPSLTGQDASDADFVIARTGGDTRGPVVVAGSIVALPNPVVRPASSVLTATLDDSRTGGSDIAAAEWSEGYSPAPAGSGTAMSGSFDSTVVEVTDTIDSSILPCGFDTLWVRGRDAAGAWGGASSLMVVVNGCATSVAPGDGVRGAFFGLAQNVPNPFNPVTDIRFGLERSGKASLIVYDVTGREVTRLVDGELPAGGHEIRWDGRDARGRDVASGIYFYRLTADDKTAVRKMVLMK